MGNCCGDERRKKEELKEMMDAKARGDIGSGGKTDLRMQRKEQNGSTSAKPENSDNISDTKKLHAAIASNDVVALSQLLRSTAPIDSIDEKMHEWIKNPRTVGGLAAYQLSICINGEDGANMKDKIREAGALPRICEFLSSDQEDKVQIAVMLLSALAEKNETNGRLLFKQGVMQMLIPHLSSSIKQMRECSGSCLHDIYILDDSYKEEFVKNGGVPPLVKMLKITTMSHPEEKYHEQLDALFNLQDLTLDSADRPIPEAVVAIKKVNGIAALQALSKVSDEEVAEVAAEFLKQIDA
eukprot:GHVL01018773.1.p1 GENE.GHVL01018773.1~~GHVL01018773.1.p1  ORF type:complete len:297 (-),score=62.55 GHVL01018773.1:746-1636(-)